MAPLSPDLTSHVPYLTMNNGVAIPQVGFGVFKVPPADTRAAVTSALDIGYRHLDTAKLYGNEAAVGEAIKESGLDRSDLFVTTKVWNDDQGYDATLRAFDDSMERLGLDQLDLYLIHWPYPGQDMYVDTWRALERVYTEGRVGSIGVSNFQPHHIQRLLDETDTVPAVNQVELHPWLQQRPLREFHTQHGILTEAWSPISRGARLDDPTIARLADKHATSPAQVILRWHLDIGNVIIPKSVRPERMAANLDLFGIRLDDDDHATIARLDHGTRIGPDPDQFGA